MWPPIIVVKRSRPGTVVLLTSHRVFSAATVMMPGLSGYEVLEKIRQRHPLAELPIIMATSKDRSDDVVHALRLGANDYVTKPVDFDVLIARIETHLAIRRHAVSIAKEEARGPVTPSGEDGQSTKPPRFARIDRYEIIQPLGHGGMGSVYLARDPALGRLIAIKLIRDGGDDPERRERFAREARSAAQLSHTNIVTIYDVGEHEGQPYIAMEFVPGESLAAIIARRAERPMHWNLTVMERLCAGLSHAHRAGIVHRDIKPANVMITPDGALKILDFGIARRTDSDVTHSATVLGTLNYMSPEQLSGERVDARSDIFALGAVFYEILSHQQAFPGTVQDGVLRRILEASPRPLRELCPALAPELIAVVEQALEKDPVRRQPDVDAIQRVLSDVSRRLKVGMTSTSS
jgi:serine/threonine protein kinase